MNGEIAPAVVLVGGPNSFRRLAREYAQVQGWGPVLEIEPCLPMFTRSWSEWSAAIGYSLVSLTSTGDRILVLAQESSYQGWERAVRRAGRKVDVPLHGLELGWQMIKLWRWIGMLEKRSRR